MSVGTKRKRDSGTNSERDNSSTDLPEGWAQCTTGDVATIFGGGTPSSQDETNFANEDGIPWITPADLSGYNALYVSRGKRFLTEKGYQSSSARLLPKHSVLFSSRAPIGYVAVAANELATNQGFKSFVCTEAVQPEYMYFWLRFAKPLAEELASGTTFAEISGANCKLIPLRLPPLCEQRRIVSKLELLLGKVSSSQQRLSRVPSLLKRFRQSVLAAACSGKLTADWREDNPEVDGAETTLKQIDAEVAERQLAKGRGKPKALKKDQIPDRCIPYPDDGFFELPHTWVWTDFGRIVNNHDGQRVPIKAEDRAVRRGAYPYYGAFGIIDQFDDYRFDGEFLLLAEDGKNLESRTRPIALQATGKFWVNNHAHVLTPKAGIAIGYLDAWLNSSSLNLTPYLTGIDQVKLNREAMDQIPVPLPPVSEQQEIVRRVKKLFAFADQIEARLKQAQTHVDRLTQSLLAKAFRGELVPTEAELARREHRGYEPASALLERIRSSSPSPVKKTRQRKA